MRVADVWPCLPSGDCAVWSGRSGFGAELGMRDRRGMDAGCESGAGCLRGASGPSEFRASGYFVRLGSPAIERAKQNPPPCMEVASGGCQPLVFAYSSRRGRAAGVAPWAFGVHPAVPALSRNRSMNLQEILINPQRIFMQSSKSRILKVCELMASVNSASILYHRWARSLESKLFLSPSR